MKRIQFYLFLFFILLTALKGTQAQTGNNNLWLDHLPYNNCRAVAEAGNRIFAATPYSLFYFDKTDNSLNRLNKVMTGGLSDIGISSMAYCSKLSTLVVAYTNTNIDLVSGNTVVNIPDIKRKQILGNKTINSILVIDKLAYLACGFGIVVLDIEKEEIKDTWYIGSSGSQLDVKALTYHAADDRFYAATENGVYSAPASSNLAYFVNWTRDMSIPSPDKTFNLITSFGGKIYANQTVYGWENDSLYVKDGSGWKNFRPADHENRTSMRVCGDQHIVSSWFIQVFNPDGSLYTNYSDYNPGVIRPTDAIRDAEGNIWVADNENGLWQIGQDLIGKQYIFNGPAAPLSAAMDISGRQLWVVPGGRTGSYTSLFRSPMAYTLSGSSWSSFTSVNTPAMSAVRDILCVAADPNKSSHVFMGSWGQGLLEFEDGALTQMYNTTNSSLQYFSGYGEGYLRVGGVAFDANSNLWVTNDGAPNILSVRKPSGEWKSFNLGSQGTAIDVGGLVVDKEGQKWMQVRDLALLVFDDNNTPDNTADDQVRKLTSSPGNGNLPGSAIYCMTVDRDGQLWLGTDQGVAVIYSPGNVFTGGNCDAQRIQVEEEGYLHPLLETEAVNAIAINGNNEKWIGTDKAGVFLMSADGTQQLLHFTEANSPLLSNSIQSIRIADNGIVYFATSLGIVSYQDYKVEPPLTLDSLTFYPNPVRPEYNGPVYIRNVVAESNVKITDVSGALVWETQAQGGQVIWDGNNLEGRRVQTGVYYIFVTNADGSQKKTGKLLFVR
jgi:hypothetical protein